MGGRSLIHKGIDVDTTTITDAILAVDASPLAKEEGARLCQAYVDKFAESDASRFKVLDVEQSQLKNWKMPQESQLTANIKSQR